MPAKTGASHGLAAFLTFLVGSMLSKSVWDIMPPVGELSLFIVETLQSITGVYIQANKQTAGTLVIMIVLSILWGVVYHLQRHS